MKSQKVDFVLSQIRMAALGSYSDRSPSSPETVPLVDLDLLDITVLAISLLSAFLQIPPIEFVFKMTAHKNTITRL